MRRGRGAGWPIAGGARARSAPSTPNPPPALTRASHQSTHRSEDAVRSLKALAAGGLAALLVATAAAPALAAPAPGSQGALLDQLQSQQKAGAVKAVTVKQVTKAAPPPLATTAKLAAKPAAKPAPKKAAPAPKAAPKAAPKPAAVKLGAGKVTKGTVGTVAVGAAPAAKGAGGKVVLVQPQVKNLVTGFEPAKKAAPAKAASSAAAGDVEFGPALQAGAVLAAEAAGLAIASAVVGAITAGGRRTA